jgi:hypothetical protein
VGCGLSLGNIRVLRFVGTRLLAHLRGESSAGKGSLVLLVALFQLKLAVLAALIYGALKLLPIDPLGLLLGLSVLPLAIVARGIQYGLRSPPETLADSYREN